MDWGHPQKGTYNHHTLEFDLKVTGKEEERDDLGTIREGIMVQAHRRLVQWWQSVTLCIEARQWGPWPYVALWLHVQIKDTGCI